MTRVAAAAALAALVLAGCGSETDHRREAVDAYVAKVNDVQRDALVPWQRAQRGYVAVGSGKVTDAQLRDLAAAPKTIRRLRARIAAVSAPKDATRLRARLLRLLDLDARFATEVAAFARYVRDVSAPEQQVAASTAQLRRALQRTKESAAEQRALARYAARLDGIVRRMRRLAPPRSLAPWHAEQVDRMTALRAAARDLARGLSTRNVALTQQGLQELATAAGSSPVTEAERDAILAYNARLRQIRKASAAVATEQNRLTKELT
jgi:hypothetical protein